ncbi:hypothetical protein MAR_017577 [Mya arenaria]|uniref:MAM domain-containing protein n=1 Tax=Mya arenaria TaxID=6604 RepID=A0ABY7EEQ6_MYAAR|nr:hypothetical protein MAR_017577 [Mya arenaria]
MVSEFARKGPCFASVCAAGRCSFKAGTCEWRNVQERDHFDWSVGDCSHFIDTNTDENKTGTINETHRPNPALTYCPLEYLSTITRVHGLKSNTYSPCRFPENRDLPRVSSKISYNPKLPGQFSSMVLMNQAARDDDTIIDEFLSVIHHDCVCLVGSGGLVRNQYVMVQTIFVLYSYFFFARKMNLWTNVLVSNCFICCSAQIFRIKPQNVYTVLRQNNGVVINFLFQNERKLFTSDEQTLLYTSSP